MKHTQLPCVKIRKLLSPALLPFQFSDLNFHLPKAPHTLQIKLTFPCPFILPSFPPPPPKHTFSPVFLINTRLSWQGAWGLSWVLPPPMGTHQYHKHQMSIREKLVFQVLIFCNSLWEGSCTNTRSVRGEQSTLLSFQQHGKRTLQSLALRQNSQNAAFPAFCSWERLE